MKRKFNFKVFTLVLSLLLGVAMLGTGIAAANGAFLPFSGTVSMTTADGQVAYRYDTPSAWTGTVWNLGTVAKDGVGKTTTVYLTNLHSHTVNVLPTVSVSGCTGVTAKWMWAKPTVGYVDVDGVVPVLVGTDMGLMLEVKVATDATESCTPTITIGIATAP